MDHFPSITAIPTRGGECCDFRIDPCSLTGVHKKIAFPQDRGSPRSFFIKKYSRKNPCNYLLMGFMS